MLLWKAGHVHTCVCAEHAPPVKGAARPWEFEGREVNKPQDIPVCVVCVGVWFYWKL